MTTVSKRFNAKHGISTGTQPVNVIDANGLVTTRQLIVPGNAPHTVNITASSTLIGDVALTLPNSTGTIGQVLTTDGTGALYWGTIPTGGALAFSDLTDVVVANPSPGQVVTYDGVKWVNSAAKIQYKGIISILPAETKQVDLVPLDGVNVTSKWQVVLTCQGLSYVQAFDLHALLRADTATAQWTKVAILGNKINIQINIIIAGSAAELTFTNSELETLTVEYIRLST